MKPLLLTAAFAIALLTACSDGGTSSVPTDRTGNTCIAGTLSCPCGSGNACLPTDDGTHLVCDRGYCVPDACPRGTEDCACYANGSCNPLDGVPMTCRGNVCVETEPTETGGLGAACAATAECAPLDDGTALRCLQGVCAIPGCAFETLGCPCGPFGACDEHDGLALGCLDGLCVRGDCEDGALACPCAEGDLCDGDLSCERGLCRSPGQLSIAVRDPRARSCEVLFDEGRARVTGVDFAPEVRGQFYRRHPHVAAAFIPWQDEPFVAPTLSLSWDGDLLAPEDRPHVVQISCYDTLGNPLFDPDIEVLD